MPHYDTIIITFNTLVTQIEMESANKEWNKIIKKQYASL